MSASVALSNIRLKYMVEEADEECGELEPPIHEFPKFICGHWRPFSPDELAVRVSRHSCSSMARKRPNLYSCSAYEDGCCDREEDHSRDRS